MAKLGSVLGPFPGTFWIDVGTLELVLHEGREGTAAEVHVPISAPKMAEILEGLMVDPVVHAPGPVLVEPIDRRYEVPPAVARSVATTAEGRRRISAARPKWIRCACGSRREVGNRGAIPKRCSDCSPPESLGTLGRSIEGVVSKRGA
jgi:hypothetical protein